MSGLVTAVQEALDHTKEAREAIRARDEALDRLMRIVGGDRLSAIRNGQHRIGVLLTEGAPLP